MNKSLKEIIENFALNSLRENLTPISKITLDVILKFLETM